jgi:nucleoside 2-deoxyribosyltransferase
MSCKKIYLAGGFKSGWQDKIISLLPDTIEVYDPRSHKLSKPADYTKWDLDAIKQSDVVIAYMEKNNPGGYALALEIGYAKALGKSIFLIDEHDDAQRQHYFEMVREVSDKRYESFGLFTNSIDVVVADFDRL